MVLSKFEQMIYAGVVQAVHGRLVRITRGKSHPRISAHIAHRHAESAVHEWRLRAQLQAKRGQR